MPAPYWTPKGERIARTLDAEPVYSVHDLQRDELERKLATLDPASGEADYLLGILAHYYAEEA